MHDWDCYRLGLKLWSEAKAGRKLRSSVVSGIGRSRVETFVERERRRGDSVDDNGDVPPKKPGR